MYSARTVNFASNSASNAGISEIIPARESEIQGLGGVFISRQSDFNLLGREAWLFISIKNRSFNKQYIKRFIDLCSEEGIKGYICPVDTPYIYNRMAELKSDTLGQEEIDKIKTVSSEIARMAQKVINGSCCKDVAIVQWCDLEQETPEIYLEELSTAFHGRTRIRDALYEHVRSVKAFDTERDFERYSEFFLREVPVLMHTYYRRGGALDMYPGPQPNFFWQIELGDFENELPALTKLAKTGRPLLYLDTHNRRN